jgi:predicted dehydrogenase
MTGPRVVIAGAGANVLGMHEPGLAAIGANIVAVHDIDTARARAVADRLGTVACDTVGELLDKGADLAVVLVPHRAHARLVEQCLTAGHDVLVEKPLAVSPADAHRMCAVARHTGRVLAVACQQRTRTEVTVARELLRTGGLGRVQRVDLLATWPRRTSYFRTAPWRGTWHGEGGGVLINQGQHDLDVLCHLLGVPAAVTAKTTTVVHPVQTEDTATALLTWPGGHAGTLHISTAEYDEPQRIEVTGTRGRLRLVPGRLTVRRYEMSFDDYAASPGDPYAPPDLAPTEVTVGTGGSHVDLYQNLVAAIASGTPPEAPAADVAGTVELTAALIQSGQLGTEVAVPVDPVGYAELLARLSAR